jgi:hypothetical protein
LSQRSISVKLTEPRPIVQVAKVEKLRSYDRRQPEVRGSCALKSRCTMGSRRSVTRHVHDDALQRMQQRTTPEVMRLRRSIVEHPFANLKYRIFGHQTVCHLPDDSSPLDGHVRQDALRLTKWSPMQATRMAPRPKLDRLAQARLPLLARLLPSVADWTRPRRRWRPPASLTIMARRCDTRDTSPSAISLVPNRQCRLLR